MRCDLVEEVSMATPLQDFAREDLQKKFPQKNRGHYRPSFPLTIPIRPASCVQVDFY